MATRLMMGAVAWLALSAATAAAPTRIVSLNPCVDAILMHVADPARIAAISHYSHDPAASSIPQAQARRFPALFGTAEEVIALRPDLVIAGAHIALATRTALKRAGIRMLLLEVPTTIAQSRSQITQVAAAIGAPNRGRVLNARIDTALRASLSSGTPVPAVIWLGDGLVPGSATLANELLTWTGFRNMSADYGLATWDVLATEHLIARPPRVIFTPSARRRDGSFTAASQTVRARALARIGAHKAEFRPQLLYCAGPTLIEASARMAAARRAVTR